MVVLPEVVMVLLSKTSHLIDLFQPRSLKRSFFVHSLKEAFSL